MPLVQIKTEPAGSFSEWLRRTEASLGSGTGVADVPCGACTACCRSSMFIHVRPEETRTLRRIPRRLLFPAPGLPKGHMVMGYNDQGHCPMLLDDRCSIYEDRPQTCRDYDCRIFAATGIAVDPATQPDIAGRVRQWKFDFETEESREEQAILQKAAAFLQGRKWLPDNPAELAAIAVRIYRRLAGLDGASDEAILQIIRPRRDADTRR